MAGHTRSLLPQFQQTASPLEVREMQATTNNQVGLKQGEFWAAGWLIGVALVATNTACGTSPENVPFGAIATKTSELEVESAAAKADHISVKAARVTGKAESGPITTDLVKHYCGLSCPPPSAPINWYCSSACGNCDYGALNAVACDVPTPPPPLPRGPVIGVADGFSGDGNTFSGWACDKHMAKSVDVHFYLDARAGLGGIGPLVKTANLPREAAVGLACGTSGVPHGWSVDVTPYRAAYAGRTIYVYGISVSGGPNLELVNSGMFTIPRL